MGSGRPEGNPGNKGGGRKSFFDEKVRNYVITKSWDKLNKLIDEGTPDEQKQIAMMVCSKTIPQNIQLEANVEVRKLEVLLKEIAKS